MGTLSWNDVSISYRVRGESEPLQAVKNVSLSLAEGATIGVAGESGSGKSTLAMSVLRLLPRNAIIDGTIELDGQDITAMSWGKLRAVRWTDASIVFQGAMSSLNPVQRVRKQLLEALQLHSKPEWNTEAKRNQRVDELMQLVDLPVSKANSYPHELSGGQKQRIMIAMAMCCDPDIIIADEPTTALDVVVQDQVLQVLKGLVESRGLSLLMISHDLSVLAATCDELVVMHNGELVERGPSQQVFNNPQHPHTKELAAAFPVIGDPKSRLRVGRRQRSEAAEDQTPVTPMTGDQVAGDQVTGDQAAVDQGSADKGSADQASAAQVRVTRDQTEQPEAAPAKAPGKRTTASGQVKLEVRDLSVHFHTPDGTVKAVDNVSLTCNPGEIVALVGQSGSGKTTLARTILGLQKPTKGQVLYDDAPLGLRHRQLKAYRHRVQFVPQDPAASLNPKHTVYEAVAEGLEIHKIRGNQRELVAKALEQAELVPPQRFFKVLPQELSGGQRQRVIIAGALALQPDYLIADEPVASLDASVRGEILALLLNLKKSLGLGALVITHDLGLAWNIADRVLVMHQGKIVESGPVEEVLLHPEHEYTRKLLSVVPSLNASER